MEVKKIVEGMTAPQVAQVIDDNFKAQNKILEEDIQKQNSVIGVSEYKDFSSSESVAVGAVRLYNGVLYECVEATTGAFDASKWKATSFKKETEAKLSELLPYTNQFKSVLGALELEQGSYDGGTGQPIENLKRVRTKKNDVNSLYMITVKEGFNIVQAFYYKSDSSFSRVEGVTANQYIVSPRSEEVYVAFNFKKVDSEENFGVNEDFGLIAGNTLRDVFNYISDVKQSFLIKQGVKTEGSNGKISSGILKKECFMMFCLIDPDGCVGKYAIISSTGKDIEGKSNYYRFEPNKWYIIKVLDSFVTEQAGWGCFVNAENALKNGNCLFKANVNVDKDLFEKLDSCFNDKSYINQAKSNLGLLKIERGSYDSSTGVPYAVATRLRTAILPIDTFEKISVKEGFYIVQAFYYKGAEDSSFSRRVDIIGNDFEVLPKEGETHLALNFRKKDGNEVINQEEDLGIILNGGVFTSIKEIKGVIFKTEYVEYNLSGFYSINSGELMSSNGYGSSKKYKTSRIERIRCNARGQGTAAGIVFFDKYEQFIGGYQTNFGTELVIPSNEFPENAVYVAFSKNTQEGFADGYTILESVRISDETEPSFPFKRYFGKKLCSIGSSSTYPGEWQKHMADWLGFEFDNKENQQGKGFVRIEGADSYWLGVEYSETLPENATEGVLSMSGTDVVIWTENNGNIWRRAFQTSKGGDSIKANNVLNIFARAFDVKWYRPNVVFLMCYNEINYMTTEQPFGSLGTIDDEPVFTPNTSASIYASYKGVIEYITKNIPMCEIVLVSTKLNTYEVYGNEESTMSDIRYSERYKKDKIYHDAVKEIAEYYGVKFVDLFHNTGMTPWSIVDYMQGLTDVHCNSKGQLEYIANNIYKQFMS